MAYTRANIESILIRRTGKWLTMAGLDGTTVSGANGDLNDPLGYALRVLGITVANITSVADSDLTGVDGDSLDELLDLSEWRTLNSILQNYDAVSLSVGGRSESYGQFADRLEAALKRKQEQIENTYGLGLGSLEAGVIQLDFEQRSDTLSTTILPS